MYFLPIASLRYMQKEIKIKRLAPASSPLDFYDAVEDGLTVPYKHARRRWYASVCLLIPLRFCCDPHIISLSLTGWPQFLNLCCSVTFFTICQGIVMLTGLVNLLNADLPFPPATMLYTRFAVHYCLFCSTLIIYMLSSNFLCFFFPPFHRFAFQERNDAMTSKVNHAFPNMNSLFMSWRTSIIF